MLQYQDSYTMYDKISGEFIFNKLAYISEQYAYELQKYNYKNGLIIKNNYLKIILMLQKIRCTVFIGNN